MQGSPQSNPPPPSPPIARAQAALGEVAGRLLAIADELKAIARDLPLPPDLADRQEHRLPYDVATDLLGTVECVLEDRLRPAVESLQRASEVTDAELARDFKEREKRRHL